MREGFVGPRVDRRARLIFFNRVDPEGMQDQHDRSGDEKAVGEIEDGPFDDFEVDEVPDGSNGGPIEVSKTV